MFSINQPLFLQKTKHLHPNPKYLFGIGIGIWATKNQGFIHRVSVFRWHAYSSTAWHNGDRATLKLH